SDRLGMDTEIVTGLDFVAHINRACGIVTDEDDGESRRAGLGGEGRDPWLSSFLMSSRTRFPSRIRGILLNHNLRGNGTVTMNSRAGFELRPQGFRRSARFMAFQLLMQLGRDLQKFPVSRLPDFEKRARVQPALDWSAAIQAL